MKRAYTRRIAVVEATILPPFVIPDDLSTLSDAELDRLMAWYEWMCGPKLAATLRQLSDAERAAFLQMDDASAEAYLQGRMR